MGMRIWVFLFIGISVPACKKKSTDVPSIQAVQQNSVTSVAKKPQHPGAFSLSMEPMTDNAAHKHMGVKIAFALPADADFFEVAVCDKAHPTNCGPTKEKPDIFSGSAPVVIPNPLAVSRTTTVDLDVWTRV